MSIGSQDVLDTFSALNSDGFAAAADVLTAAAAVEAAGILNRVHKLEVQHILLERGVFAAQTRLDEIMGQQAGGGGAAAVGAKVGP